MSDETTYTGGCLCGAVRYRARGEPLNVRACHCTTCRKASGALIFVRAVFPGEAVERTGKTTVYRSSARLQRRFCPTCGSLVFGEPVDAPQFISISVATLDDVEALKPQAHIWAPSKPSWLMLCDGLPEHPQSAPA